MGSARSLSLVVFFIFTLMNDSRWFITPDRALHVEETGGCWVELSRFVSHYPDVSHWEFDCAFFGPVDRIDLDEHALLALSV